MLAVTITTHKRPEQCLYTLEQLPPGCDVSVFHDKCDSDYSKVQQYCKEHGYFYYQTPVHYGKWGYWQIHNLMYEHLDGKDFDYYLQLPDDALMVPDIGIRGIQLLADELSCVNVISTKIGVQKLTKIRKIVTLPSGIKLIAAGWLDCCIFTTKAVMQGFRIEANWRSIQQNPLKSSGVGHSQAKAYLEKTGKTAMMAYHALVADYTEFVKGDTVMHTPGYTRKFHTGKVFNFNPQDRIAIKKRFNEFQSRS